MAELKEQQYVHKVYDEIAHHFSETRYKPWPVVANFLNSQPMGAIGIDVGCGNGKYLGVNPYLFIIGSDRSSGLIQCAHDINSRYNVLIADGLQLPHKDGTFDFAISIAVVHHWTTRERRIAAIAHILTKLRPEGQALIYCWALEQNESRRGYHEGMEQDVLVPWVLKSKKPAKTVKLAPEKVDLSDIPLHERAQYVAEMKKKRRQELRKEQEELEKQQQQEASQETRYRFYHLYRRGELEEDCEAAGGTVIGTGYERDNWYAIVKPPAK
ncbi:hypothetical protein ZYGR_0AK05550 [Zygosaccharomyces rouxii]|uniref:Methyltransferase type 11 domain-containing protein n=1 Tax=Zygosaccharomyces rouxii TaxID=4956 RepID=A0A1Q3AF02_ZYGRO|nr:hypothetical protein ZYGR_0AK05550 [Zygosaccharomyces rouxii]